MAHDALEAHARDELGITPQQTARPIQAAWRRRLVSRSARHCLWRLPAIGPEASLLYLVSGTSLFFLRCWEGWLRAWAGPAWRRARPE